MIVQFGDGANPIGKIRHGTFDAIMVDEQEVNDAKLRHRRRIVRHPHHARTHHAAGHAVAHERRAKAAGLFGPGCEGVSSNSERQCRGTEADQFGAGFHERFSLCYCPLLNP